MRVGFKVKGAWFEKPILLTTTRYCYLTTEEGKQHQMSIELTMRAQHKTLPVSAMEGYKEETTCELYSEP